MTRFFYFKTSLALLIILFITPNMDTLKTFVFGFGIMLTPSIIILSLVCLQMFFLKNKPLISIVLWVIMVFLVLLNPMNGWPTGLVVNFMITFLSIPLTVVIAVLLAISRFQNKIKLLRWSAITLTELTRGVPLIGLMIFVLSVGVDLVPATWALPKIVTIWLVYSFFAGVYLAEIFRGGLVGIPETYFNGLDALGMSPFKSYAYIILPKVLFDTMPAAFNVYIGLFKETSLVLMFGYFDLMNIALNYLDLPEHYPETKVIYLMVLILFWLVATCIHEFGKFLHKQCYQYERVDHNE
jgi:ABC-type amino acid transport system permease subunit